MGGILGGSSDSRSSSEVNDFRIGADNGAIVVTDGAQLDFLTDETFERALSFAQNEGDGNRSLVSEVIGQAFDAVITNQNEAFNSIVDSQDQAFEQTGIALQSQRSEGLQGFRELLIAGVAITALVSGIMIFRGRK